MTLISGCLYLRWRPAERPAAGGAAGRAVGVPRTKARPPFRKSSIGFALQALHIELRVCRANSARNLAPEANMTKDIIRPELRRIVRKLNLREQHIFNNFLVAEYAKTGMYDGEFAKLATEKLGFEITAFNVQGAREAFNIPSTRETMRAQNTGSQEHLIIDLQRRVTLLEQRMQVYLDGCCKPNGDGQARG
jgi:hypothetical protein